jgi:CRP-like cAMP-binding protein
MMVDPASIPRTADHILRWFLTRVDSLEPEQEGDHHRAYCPNHSGQRKALVVGAFEDDGLGVKCEAGCPTDAILAALGMTHEDLSLYPQRNGYKGKFRTITLAELMAKEFPPTKWIVEGVIPQGTMILGGKPKMGKSWLMLGLCISVATGMPALNSFEVEKGDVLYLALEDKEARLQERAAKILATAGTEFAPSHRLDLAVAAESRLDTGLVNDLEEWLEHHPQARLIVIDTLARVRGKSSRERSLYEQDYEVGADLTTLAARHSVAIVLVHHLKKGEENDPLDLLSGSTGLTAGVDGVMVLNRTRSAADAILKAVHRELKDDPELALKWDAEAGRWEYLGPAEEYMMGKERREVMDVLAREDGSMRPAEVADAIGKDPKTIARTMQRMRDDGFLTSHSYGKYEINPHADTPTPLSVPLKNSSNTSDGQGEDRRSGRTDVVDSKVEGEVRHYDRYDYSSGDVEGEVFRFE